MRRQFLGELERLQSNVREKEDIIHQLNQEKTGVGLLKSTIKTLEDTLRDKEKQIEKLKSEFAENGVNVKKGEEGPKSEASDEVVSDDNEGDGYRIDIDFIKILVDVETDTRALVEKEKGKILQEPELSEEEKKRTTTKLFDSESLDLEDTIASNLPDLDEQGLEAELMGSSSCAQNKKQANPNLTPGENFLAKGDDKGHKEARLKVPFADVNLRQACSQCQRGDIWTGDMEEMIKDVEEKVSNHWSELVEGLSQRNEELMTARYKVETTNVGVNTEIPEDEKNGDAHKDSNTEGYSQKQDIIKMISDIEDEVKGRMDWSHMDNTVKTAISQEEKIKLEHKNSEEGKMAVDKKDGEREKEEKDGEEKIDVEEGYNWNNDIIKIISDVEDDVKRRMDQGSKEDIGKRAADMEKEELGDEPEYGECEEIKGEELVKEGKDNKKKEDEEVEEEEETYDEVGYNWKTDIIKIISDIEDDVKGRINQNIKEDIVKKATGQKAEKMDLELRDGEMGKTKEKEELEENMYREGKKDDEEGEEGKSQLNNEETGDEEVYNWKNDIIRMISDIEDDVKERIDQSNKEELYQLQTSTGHNEEDEPKEGKDNKKGQMVKDNTDENEGETRLKEEKADDAKEYNWNNDIIKIISDTEDDVERRIAQRRKEDILETASNKENKEKSGLLERQGDENKDKENKDGRYIDEFNMDYMEIKAKDEAVVEKQTAKAVNEKSMECQVIEKEERKEKNWEDKLEKLMEEEKKTEERVVENKAEEKNLEQKEAEKKNKVEQKEMEEEEVKKDGDYVVGGDFIKMVSDVEDDVNRAWSEKTKKMSDVGVNTIMENERVADTAAGNQETVKKSSVIEDGLDTHQEKEFGNQDESSANLKENVRRVYAEVTNNEANNECETITGEKQSWAGVDSDRSKVSFSLESSAIEMKRDDADSCSLGQDPRSLDKDMEKGVVARLSGEEEIVEGCGESSVLVPGDSSYIHCCSSDHLQDDFDDLH